MSTLGKQLLDEIKDLKLRTMHFKPSEYSKSSLVSILSSKEIIHISPEKRDEMFSWEPSILFPGYKKYYDDLEDSDKSKNDYTNLKDGHDISELFAKTKRFRVKADYLRYIKNSTDGFIINLYGGEISLKSTEIWNLTNCPNGRKKFADRKIPPYEFATPSEITYKIIGKPIYDDKVLIESCLNSIPTLAVDLPFSYYRTQSLNCNIFTWDIVAEKYQVGGLEIEEINPIITKIAENGFQEPLVMRINEGCISPIDNDTAINLLLATYLRLPSIPAVLYMTNDHTLINEEYEELFDVVNHGYWTNPQAMYVINRICKPYFFFEMAADVENKVHLELDGSYFHKNQYPPMNDITEPGLLVYDRYLDTSAKVEDIIINMEEEQIKAMIDSKNEELRVELHEKLRIEQEETKNKILVGDY
jgi:hypothetical protein